MEQKITDETNSHFRFIILFRFFFLLYRVVWLAMNVHIIETISQNGMNVNEIIVKLEEKKL